MNLFTRKSRARLQAAMEQAVMELDVVGGPDLDILFSSSDEATNHERAVDIRGLDKTSDRDSYQIPLQSDLFPSLLGYAYITNMDCMSFCYQLAVKPGDHHKLTKKKPPIEVRKASGSPQWGTATAYSTSSDSTTRS